MNDDDDNNIDNDNKIDFKHSMNTFHNHAYNKRIINELHYHNYMCTLVFFFFSIDFCLFKNKRGKICAFQSTV